MSLQPLAAARRSTTPAIEVEELTKMYPGARTAVADISFDVGRGEIFGFLGPNGSGKTTTVKILVTLLRQTSGTARVGGFETARDPQRVRGLIGYTGQSVGVDDDLTVHEHLILQALLHDCQRRSAQERSDELVEALGLGGVLNERVARLSGGLRRRVDLAQALVHAPEVLFLDEPTTGLDPQSRNSLWLYLRRLSRGGMTIFLTTQYLEEADRACDRVAIIDHGRLAKVGSPIELKTEVGEGRLLLTLEGESDRPRAIDVLSTSPAVARVNPGAPGTPLVAFVRDIERSVPLVLRLLTEEGIDVTSVEAARASLDDVFMHYTGSRPIAEAASTGRVSGMFSAVHGRRRHG